MSTYTTIIDGIDYGPLAALIGSWEGNRGVDVSPEPYGEAREPYFETITFEAGGDLTNANEQKLVIVIYHQVVSRKSDQKVFHHQMGYWTWDAATGVIAQSVTIPRAVTLLAGGVFPRATNTAAKSPSASPPPTTPNGASRNRRTWPKSQDHVLHPPPQRRRRSPVVLSRPRASTSMARPPTTPMKMV